MLTLDAASGTCLGLSAIHPWLRHEAAKHNYPDLPIEAKESYRWLKVAESVKKRLHQAVMTTIIADGESDIYEEWVRIPDEKTHLLTRVCRDRHLDKDGKLYAYTDSLPVKATYALDVPARAGISVALIVRLWKSILVISTSSGQRKNQPWTFPLRWHSPSLMSAKQRRQRSNGEAPIHWRLFTAHPVNNVEQARQIIGWYRQRWHIEQLFRTVKKQGLNIESSQLETAEGLTKLAVPALQVAVKSMQLTLTREGTASRLASNTFDQKEIDVLTILHTNFEGKTTKQKSPYESGQLSWVAWIIARLGGWKGYRSKARLGQLRCYEV